MDATLLRRILDQARGAATPSDAMLIEDLGRDLEPLFAVLEGEHCEEPMDVAAYVADFRALAAHAKTQPFDVVHNEDDEEGRVILSELTPGAFEEWLGELERLAQ